MPPNIKSVSKAKKRVKLKKIQSAKPPTRLFGFLVTNIVSVEHFLLKAAIDDFLAKATGFAVTA